MGLDARFISGLSNADAISQWDDQSASTNHAIQSTSARRPTYRTAVSGGSPTVRFTPAANSWDSGQYLLLTSAILYGEMTIFSFYRTSSNRMVVFGGNGNFGSPPVGVEFYGGTQSQLLWRASNDTGTTINYTSGSSFVVNCSTRDSSGNTEVRIDNTSRGTSSVISTNSSFKAVGARKEFGSSDGDIGCVYVVPSVLGNSLISRITQSIAASFKVSCN